MATLTFEQLRNTMIVCAGADDAAALTGDIADADFAELGYDSLALIETLARLSQDLGVRLPEPNLGEITTPQELLDFVNAAFVAGTPA